MERIYQRLPTIIMPNMAAVGMVPFIPRSESVSLSQQSPPRAKPRMYDDGPLPVQASSSAPRNARIVNRILDAGEVTFELQIGSTTINDVGLDEVLEYVSMYELESYENRAFEEERELLRIAKEEEERLKVEKLERMKERAKQKGVVVESSGEGGREEEEEEVATGKHGRARPSYKHMYKKFKERRRRKRDPRTGELLPLSDEDEGQALEYESSEDEPAGGALQDVVRPSSSRAPLVDPMEMPKRRRRKRDPVTGELMPLDPLPQELSRRSEELVAAGPSSEPALQLGEKPKRPRRRRHPVTGELMPLGWRYDPAAEESGKVAQRAPVTVPDVKRLSISQEHQPKRRRLKERSSSAQGSESPRIKPANSTRAGGALNAFKSGGVVHMGSSEDDEDEAEDIAVVQSTSKPKPKLIRRNFPATSMAQSTATSTAPESSPERLDKAMPDKRAGAGRVASRSASSSSASSGSSIIPLQANSPPSRFQRPIPTTSITHPSAAAPAVSSSESDSEMAEDEWVIEAILNHGKSDPKTHPSALGKEPVMLYQVKWEGSDELTWEPLSSFASLETVREYQRAKGLAVEPQSEEGG